jgi:NAD-dependent dihydropyrimidine dehydrogenase PreA subunit
MPALINFKICDNAEECSGISACPTGALSWDKKKKRIAIDNEKCINCFKCEESCPTGAIRVAKTEKDLEKIKKEFGRDSRKILDLFVEKYGAKPMYYQFHLSEDKFKSNILGASKLTVVEVFSPESIECLLFSIPVKDLFKGLDVKYRKMEIENKKGVFKKYNISKLPALLFFKSGELIGKIEGYYDKEHKENLLKKINKIIKSER